MPLAEGTRVGPYRVGTLVGAGGMGEVYRAVDERLRREVAIKVMAATGTTPDSQVLHRFEQEARAASALNHPGILAVFDLGVHEGMPYVVCELLEGQTLRERLRDGPLPQRRAVEIAVEVAEALAAAHEKGIVHRDLKPENLFLLRSGRAKILDFGLAKLTRPDMPSEQVTNSMEPEDVGTRPGTVMGTVGYMSPEQVRGQPVDHRSDIFSFGAVLYEMLSGQRAFRGTSAVETMSAILKEDPPDLPPETLGTDRLVRRCLEKPPERRFQSASDLAFALGALSGVTRSAPMSTAPPDVWSRRSVNRLLAVTGGAALVGVGYGARAWTHRAAAAEPAYQRLTFRRGRIGTARFAPDGHTVVYSASWNAGSSQIYQGRKDSPDAALVPTPPAELCAVSSLGELAVLYTLPSQRRTLARLPLVGGTPREVLDGVIAADWSPDGRELAVVRRVDGVSRIEYPIGNVLLNSPGLVERLRVSPDGRRVAYTLFRAGGASVWVVEMSGQSTALKEGVDAISGLSWSSSGDEVWISAAGGEVALRLFALAVAGSERLVRAEAGPMLLQDVARDGRVLATQTSQRSHLMFRGPDDAAERDMSWFDGAVVCDLSADGTRLLYHENHAAAQRMGGVYLRPTNGQPPVRLCDGYALALSPDGAWALVHPTRSSRELRLVPASAGDPRPVPAGPLERVHFARFFSDGNRLLLSGREQGRGVRAYVQDLGRAGAPVPVTPEMTGYAYPSPDGTQVAFQADDRSVAVVPAAGGAAKVVDAALKGDAPIGWSPDGRGLLIGTVGSFPERLFVIDLAKGTRVRWRELQPADLTGTYSVDFMTFAADGRSYCYSFTRVLDDLHVGSGLT